MTRPFQFGVMAAGETLEQWVGIAREAETHGYTTLYTPDHFTKGFAPLPALVAAAMATTTLRVSALVFANDYKHPVVLTKEVATLDVISNGRACFGIGAGWMRTDYDEAGIPYDSPGVRIDRLAEALAVYRGLTADGPLTFEGQHYRITGMEGWPKPVQRPHPPIVIGGGGKRVLSLAAREADVIGINAKLTTGKIDETLASTVSEDATKEKIAWIREAAGDRYDALVLQVVCYAADVTPDRDQALAKAAKDFGVSVEDASTIPNILVGSVEEIIETLETRRAHFDISECVIPGEKIRAFAPVVERLRGR